MVKSGRMMAYTAAAMYGAALADGALEGFLPGDPSFSWAPIIVVAVIVVVLLAVGPRMSRAMLAALGPIGVVLIAVALATTPQPGDGATLYALPVLWMTVFFGKRGAVSIVLMVGIAHAAVLLVVPPAISYPDRWVDVMVSVAAIAAVAYTLERRNDQLLERVRAEARTDALTHLLNRRGFEERAQIELVHARRQSTSIAVIALDIDYFKRINDEWGHDMGDRVLVWIGSVLLATARDVDIVGRLGGEEFVVLLPGATAEGAGAFAERIRATLAGDRPESLPAVKLSAGIALDEHPGQIASLVQQADSALYEAKRTGRDRSVHYRAHEPESVL